jgi:hydrogenase expression/formation protein HypD
VRFVDEYRGEREARGFVRAIERRLTRPWTLMEICGGQTHTLLKFGIDRLLPERLTLVHGPGCPVCVTPLELIDRAIAIARRPGVILTSFGDMLRVPGSSDDLLSVKAGGGDVRMVYSPLDAVAIARRNPSRQVVFFAVGFETTAPANAMSVWQAREIGLDNFSILCSHVLVPPAMEAILGAPGNVVQGFLAAGHVCTVMGYEEYEPIAARHRVPIVVTGFEPLDLLEGIYLGVRQLEAGEAKVENQYLRSVAREGNRPAQKVIVEVFEVSKKAWRGLGLIGESGLVLREKYRAFDAELKFPGARRPAVDPPGECISGEILLGQRKPTDCPAFGTRCTPETALGATMVSNEGACSAYWKYRREASA